jgi:hypothetical protein
MTSPGQMAAQQAARQAQLFQQQTLLATQQANHRALQTRLTNESLRQAEEAHRRRQALRSNGSAPARSGSVGRVLGVLFLLGFFAAFTVAAWVLFLHH